MTRRMMAAAAVAALCSPAVQAGVVYNWLTATPSQTGVVASGRIELSSTAWASGSINYSLAGEGAANTGIPSSAFRCSTSPSGSCTDPASPIMSFGMRFQEALTGSFGGGAGFGPTIYRYDSGAFSLSTTSGLLGGSIVVHNIGEDLFLSGNPLWTVNFGTDFHGACDNDACRGITGLWVLDATTVPGFVPEPGMLPLMALGALGAIASRRRRRR